MFLADHQRRLALPPSLLLPPESEPPAEGAGTQQNQSGAEQNQAQDRDDRAVRVEGVSHGRDHHAGHQDHHAKRHRAAVAGHLGPAGHRQQLALVDVGDACRHGDGEVPPGLLDQGRGLDGGLGDPVEVVQHDLTGQVEVRHVGEQQPITAQLAETHFCFISILLE